MALHRDIFWIGRQWAVTGHGMQLIDQRLEGAFDIEVIRLWDDDLVESLRAKAWLKAEDWSCLDDFLLSYVVDPSQKATVFASSFAAALELVREGEMELNQKEAFAPLYFRKRPPQAAMPAPDMTVE